MGFNYLKRLRNKKIIIISEIRKYSCTRQSTASMFAILGNFFLNNLPTTNTLTT